ncbi:MAG: hypothetical protein AABW59_01180 [archaeon]
MAVPHTEAEKEIREALNEKNWHDYKLAPLRLNLVPYFFFNYHYYLEEEKAGHRVIKHSVDGLLSINGHKITVDPDNVELIKSNLKKALSEAPNSDYDVKWNNIEKKEQDDVIKLKTAQFFGVPKENVVISNPKKIFMPFYVTQVTIKKEKKEEDEYGITYNALSKDMGGLENIPLREKSAVEITRETLRDLKSPEKWLEYSAGVLLETGDAVKKAMIKEGPSSKEEVREKKPSLLSKAKIDFSFFDSRIILLIIMVLAAILIYLALFR